MVLYFNSPSFECHLYKEDIQPLNMCNLLGTIKRTLTVILGEFNLLPVIMDLWSV